MTDVPKPRKLAVISGGREPVESATARANRERQERFAAKQEEKQEKAQQAEKRRQQLADDRQALLDTGLNPIELTSDPAAIRDLTAAVDEGLLPDTYVREGRVVVVEEPSGAEHEDDETAKTIEIVTSDTFNRLMARHAFVFERRREKLPDGSYEETLAEVTPPAHVSRAVLDSKGWKLRPLKGIVTAPTFRTDGTLVQDPGYDPIARVIYSPTLTLERVADTPTDGEVYQAKVFLFEALLADFPWVGPSRANFVGALVGPLLRAYLGDALLPMLAVDATSPGTGKSLLASILKGTYSGVIRPWVGKDEELRKAITSLLLDRGGQVVVLDNVGKGETVDQPTLAALLTMKVWSDRILGVSGSVRVPNDRLWVVTGNSLSIGGDLGSRTVLVRLDAKQPDPSKRPSSQFVLGDLEDWLAKPANRATLLRHLLVLVRRWIADGAPRIETPMRTFTAWASAAAGFLDWLGEGGVFLANAASLAEVDEEEAQYGAFYAKWWELFPDRIVSCSELIESTMSDGAPELRRNWGSAFIRRKDGSIPTAVGLGKFLTPERGRFRGGYRLNGFWDTKSKTWSYSVTPQGHPIPEGAQ